MPLRLEAFTPPEDGTVRRFACRNRHDFVEIVEVDEQGAKILFIADLIEKNGKVSLRLIQSLPPGLFNVDEKGRIEVLR